MSTAAPDPTSVTAEEDARTDPDTPLPPTVRALGVVSLLTDLSSEMVYPVTPILLTKVLGAPPWTVGLIEGIAESTASLLKLYSGHISDRMGRRKPLTVAGYALAAVSKPLMALAGGWPHVLAARFLDRTGKGLRSAPRDALLTESVPRSRRGRAFGLHRSMDTTGAVLGPLIGYAFLRAFPDGLRWLYVLAFLPALLGVLTLLLFVHEARGRRRSPEPSPEMPRPAGPRLREVLADLRPEYRRYLLVVGLFGLGNSSDAFLLLRAQGMGVRPEHLLLLYALFNIIEASLGYAAGRLSDRVGRRPLIASGFLVFACVYLGFALASGPIAAAGLFVLYGLYYTLTQGVQKAFAADFTRADRRGAEIGVFHLLVGITALPASFVAGQLYDRVAPAAPFLMGATTALLAAVLLLAIVRPPAPASDAAAG